MRRATSLGRAPSCSATSATTRLFAVAVVASTGTPGRDLRDEVAEPPVVGPEVVAPVADAVRLVDHEHADAPHERGQLLLAERRVVEPLGRDEQHVDLVGGRAARSTSPHSCAFVELIATARTPGALGGGDLVAHEREQRRDEHGRPGAAPAQQQRRDEVHRRLAPAGALHDERAAALVDERLDRLELPVVELGVVAADERAAGPSERRRTWSPSRGPACQAPGTPGRPRHAGSRAACACQAFAKARAGSVTTT